MYDDVYFLTHEQLHLLSSFLFLDPLSIELVLCAKRRLHRNSSPLLLSPTGLICLHSRFVLTHENSKCHHNFPSNLEWAAPDRNYRVSANWCCIPFLVSWGPSIELVGPFLLPLHRDGAGKRQCYATYQWVSDAQVHLSESPSFLYINSLSIGALLVKNLLFNYPYIRRLFQQIISVREVMLFSRHPSSSPTRTNNESVSYASIRELVSLGIFLALLSELTSSRSLR